METEHDQDSAQMNSESKPFICLECTKSFKNTRSLKDHLQTHPGGERCLKCKMCSKTFKFSSYIERRTEGKPLQCKLCPQFFKNLILFTIHFKTHSGETSFHCQKCVKNTGSSELIKLKRTIKSRPKEKLYVCEHCSKNFKNQSALTKHIRSHTGEKPYQCEICSKSFRISSHLKNHTRTHTGEKPYKCHLCTKSFVVSFALKSHIRTHTEEKPYHCEECPKSFRTLYGFQYHLKCHKGERAHKCEFCPKSFINPSQLKYHLRAHNEGKVVA